QLRVLRRLQAPHPPDGLVPPVLHPEGLTAMLILAAAIWVLLTLGLTYAARDATLLALPRLYFVAKVDFLADLLGCGYCTSFWTGGAAYLLLSGIGTAALDLHPGW